MPGGRLKDLWISVSGALAQQKNVDTIANNVANANTPGFKKDQLAFKEHLTVLEKGHQDIDMPNKEWRPEDFYKSYGAERAQVQVDGSFTIHNQGNLTPTGNPFDLAINGNAFFEVLSPNGARYTRKGNFTLDKEGFLVSSSGEYLLAKPPAIETLTPGEEQQDPKTRKIQITGKKFIVTNNGDLFVDGLKTAEVSVNSFKDRHALKKEGNSLYVNEDPKNLMAQTKASVHQGFIEESNVNAIQEMSKLIKAHRHFESLQNVIKVYDEISAKTANEIAKF